MKKIIPMLLALAMVFSLVLAAVPTAEAAEHTDHCACGGKWAGKADYHTCQTLTGWTAVTNTTMALMTELTTGSYYLAEDVQLLDNLTLADGAVVTLCLNGHALMGADSQSERVFEQNTASTLNLCDCSENQTGIIASASGNFEGTGGLYLQQHEDAILNLYGGTMLGTETTLAAGVLRQEKPGGTLNMYGGRMTGGVAGTSGGNIFVTAGGGNFNMYGGVIDSGVASTKGGNIYCEGNMTLYGGAIVKGMGGNNENIYLQSSRVKIYNMDAGTDFIRMQSNVNVKEIDSSLSLAVIPGSMDNMFAENFYSLTKAGVTDLTLPEVTKPTVTPPAPSATEPVENPTDGDSDNSGGAAPVNPVIFIVIGAVVVVAVVVVVVVVSKKKKA